MDKGEYIQTFPIIFDPTMYKHTPKPQPIFLEL